MGVGDVSGRRGDCGVRRLGQGLVFKPGCQRDDGLRRRILDTPELRKIKMLFSVD